MRRQITDSQGDGRRVASAYVKSNLYFPQVRFGFVLCFLLSTPASQCIRILTARDFRLDELEIERITAAANAAHGLNGVITVLPTSSGRVEEEIAQSLKVLSRCVSRFLLGFCGVGSFAEAKETDWSSLQLAAKGLWELCIDTSLHREHLAQVGVKNPTPIRVVGFFADDMPLKRLQQHVSMCELSASQAALFKVLEPEIAHPLTIIR